ncbi:hypothetical protein V5F49_20745, partial [Xanthobacter sp. V3C-3]
MAWSTVSPRAGAAASPFPGAVGVPSRVPLSGGVIAFPLCSAPGPVGVAAGGAPPSPRPEAGSWARCSKVALRVTGRAPPSSPDGVAGEAECLSLSGAVGVPSPGPLSGGVIAFPPFSLPGPAGV